MPSPPEPEVKAKLGTPGAPEDIGVYGLVVVSVVLAKNTAPRKSPLPAWNEESLPTPMTKTIPFQLASGSYLNSPVTRSSPYPVPYQPLTFKFPLTTVIMGFDEDIAPGRSDSVAVPRPVAGFTGVGLTMVSATCVMFCTKVLSPPTVCRLGNTPTLTKFDHAAAPIYWFCRPEGGGGPGGIAL